MATGKNEAAHPKRESTEEYICRCFLDLVEEKPFHMVKVKELVSYAGISRSSFYTHFNSIYDIVQKLEDEFLDNFYPSEAAHSVLVGGSIAESLEQSSYIQEHSRTLRLLCGPNGDAYFSSRIAQTIKQICKRVWDEEGTALSPAQREALSSYIAGGTLMLTLYMTEHGDSIAPRETLGINTRVIAANNDLLGIKQER